MKTQYNLSLVFKLSLVFFFALTTNSVAQLSYTFTTAGATGSAGPTQLQTNTAYALTNLNGSVTVNGGIQSWTVPVTAAYRVQAIGAKGFGTHGGRGASISGDFTLTAGQVLKILVGQQGAPPISPGTNQYGGGGGSFVTYTNNVPLLVAGGGGGSWALAYTGLADGTVAINGNAGTGLGAVVGAGGVNGTGGSAGNNADGGGGNSGNGSGTSGGFAFVNGGNGGALFGHGGFGGGGGASAYDSRRCGGGGGYSGGGGSFWTSGNPEAGGGGSINNGTNQTNQSGQHAGDGSVIISRICNITLGSSTGSNLICLGSAITLTTDAISNYTWSTGSNNASITVSPSVTTTYTLSAMSLNNCTSTSVISITVSSAGPSLTVSPSSNSVCPNNTVSISASGALSYTFSGGISNGSPFIPLVTSVYTVQGQNGCGTASALTTVSVIPLPVIANASPTLICAGLTSTLTASGAASYTWQPGNFSGNSFMVSPQQNTTYTVTGAVGTCIGNYTVTLLTNPNPTLSLSVSHFTICSGSSSTLTAGGALNYTWQPSGSNGASIVVSPTLPIAYTVIGENSFGCTASVQQPVIVYPIPTLNISSPNPTICPGSSVTLVATGANTYSWSTGANTNTISVSPVSTTVYTVVGTFTSSQCSSSKTIEVNVFVSSLAIIAPTAVCVGSSATLQATGAGSYSWSNGAIGNNIVVSPTVASGYTVTGNSTISAGTCSSTASAQLFVNPLPNVSIVASKTLICKGYESATLTASGASTYSWITIGAGQSVVVSPFSHTTYTVIGTDLFGCVNTKTVLIRIYVDCWHLMSLNELNTSENYISAFPNPSSGHLTISSKESIQLILVNELGQIIRELELNTENAYSSEVRGLAKGVYFLNSKDPAKIVNKKIVVQ